MRKREFIRTLSLKLNNFSKEERNDVIQYYDELIEDTIDKTHKSEEEVVAGLGSIDEIVSKLNINNQNRIKYEEERKDNFTDSTHKYSEKEVNNCKCKQGKPKKNKTNFFKILVLILTFPVWFSLICVLISLMISFTVAGFAVGTVGAITIIQGIAQLSNQMSYALFEIGGGIACIGLAIIIAPLLCKIVSWIFKGICRFVSYLVGGNYSARKVCYEN